MVKGLSNQSISKTLNLIATIKRKVITWSKLPFREQIWILVLFPLSGLARVAILLIPFQYLARYLGAYNQNIQLSSIVTKEQIQTAWRIGRIVEASECITPWESTCFVQVIMVKTLLAIYGIPYVLYFGVSKPSMADQKVRSGYMNCAMNPERDTRCLAAHAWIQVGPWVVSGRNGHKTFTVVASFVSSELLEPS